MEKKDGVFALRMARSAIRLWVREGKRLEAGHPPASFLEKRGCFVTITENGKLRGCIGYPEPVMPLIDAVIGAAICACRDPRFPPLGPSELRKIAVEVSVLTAPEPIKPEDVKVGRDGLFVRRGFCCGLLLPQVAVECCWNGEEFLCQACLKAGLPRNTWKEAGVEILAFRAEVFSDK